MKLSLFLPVGSLAHGGHSGPHVRGAGLANHYVDFTKDELLVKTSTGRNISTTDPHEVHNDILFSPRQLRGMRQAGIDTTNLHMDTKVKEAFHRDAMNPNSSIFTKWNTLNDAGDKLVIPYRFASNYPAAGKTTIATALAALSGELGGCIEFLEDTTNKYTANWIEVSCDFMAGCASAIGMVGAGQMMNLATLDNGCGTSNCLGTGTIQHEFMHALGFAHEHSRPDRNAWVQINEPNIIPGAYESNFAAIGHSDWFDMGSPYDFGSVMHYSSRGFITSDANSAGLYTIEAKVGDPYIRGQRERASTLDLIQIATLYGDQCTAPTTESCADTNYQVLPNRKCDGILQDCYDGSDEGIQCMCAYNGGVGCCTGALQVDLGNNILATFDYIGWDDTFDKPWYRTFIGGFYYVLFYGQNQGSPNRCGEAGTGMWLIQRAFEKPTCQQMYGNINPVAPVVSDSSCPDGLTFVTGGQAATCNSSPLCDACTMGKCSDFGVLPGESCGNPANNLVCEAACCVCTAGKGNYDGDNSNGCEAEATTTTTTTAATTTVQPIETCDNFYPKNQRTCPSFETCIITRLGFQKERTIWELSTNNGAKDRLEDKHEVKCADGYEFPSNGVENPNGLVNVTCLCSTADGCTWQFSQPGFKCYNDLNKACPIDAIKWIGSGEVNKKVVNGKFGNDVETPGKRPEASNWDTLNGPAASSVIMGKYGAFVKSSFKPGKFDTPADFSSGIVFFLVYPMKLSEKQITGQNIEVLLWSGDDSKQLAIVEDADSTLIMLQVVNGITAHITSGKYTHFWYTLNGVDMTEAEHSSFRTGAMPKTTYDAILSSPDSMATDDAAYGSCLISRISKIPPFYWP